MATIAAPETEEPTKSTTPPTPRPREIRSWVVTGLFVLAVIAALRIGAPLLMPIALASLLSLLLAPLVRLLERFYIPAGLGAALTLVGFGVVIVAGMLYLVDPATDWLDRAPETFAEVEYKLRNIREPIEKVTQATEQVSELAEAAGGGPPEVQVQEQSMVNWLFDRTSVFLANLVFVVVLLYFLLATGDHLISKFVRLQPDADHRHNTIEIIRRVRNDVSIYLFTITMINFGLGVAVGISMWLLGMPNPILWGVMATVLNYIPYVGAIIGMATIAFVAMVSFDDPLHIMMAPLIFAMLTTAEGYVITPTVLGARLTLSPIVIFVGLMFWSWVWGIPGALMAVPLLAVIKIICDRIDRLKPVGEMLNA
ncbi:MAG: AI-2E family transporter [Phycisphaerales bacterium]